MTNKLINKLGIGALTLALAGSLNGCGREIKEPFCKTYIDSLEGVFIGAKYLNGEKILMVDHKNRLYVPAGTRSNYNMAVSNYKKNRSEEFVEGGLLENHSQEELQKIYNYVKENGEDCKIGD